jgi:hypothetical protein
MGLVKLDLSRRCDYCATAGARTFRCPHDGCDGVCLCAGCAIKRAHLLAPSNHRLCAGKRGSA